MQGLGFTVQDLGLRETVITANTAAMYALCGPYRDGPASGENTSHLCRLRGYASWGPHVWAAPVFSISTGRTVKRINNLYIYRGTSPTRKRTPLGPYRRPMPRVLGGS